MIRNSVSSRQVFGLLLALLVAVVALGSAAAQSAVAQLRFVHVVPGAPAVDVYIDGARYVEDLEFGEVSAYFTIASGPHDIRVTAHQGADALWEQSLDAPAGTSWTLVASSADSPTFQPYQDDLAPLGLGEARFTAIHAIDGGPAVDVILADGRAVVSGLEYNQTYGTLDLPAIAYEFAVAAAGSTIEDAIVGVTPYSLDSGSSYALLVYGEASAPEATLLRSVAAAETPGGNLRLVHGVAGGPAVDVYVDDTLVAPGLEAGQATGFIPVPAGSLAVSLRGAGTDEEIASASLEVEADTYQTAVAVSADGEVTLQVAADPVGQVTSEQFGITLINASEAAESAAIIQDDAEGTPVTADVAFGESASTVLDPNQYFLVVEVTAGDDSVSTNMPELTYVGGVYYTVVVISDEDGSTVLQLEPVNLADTPALVGGAATTDAQPVEVTEAAVEPVTEAATEVVVEVATEVVATEAPAATEAAPQPTAAPTQTGPTARVLLDPGANLQLRQYPSASALSLGLAPSGSTLIVNGREGAEVYPDWVTPEAEATEWVDPVTALGEDEDLNPAETWLNVSYNTPDGGSITAWVNALYVSVSGPNGGLIRLRSLPTVPSNQAGSASDTAITSPTTTEPTVQVVVGGLDEGVNLQLRRTPSTSGESLTLVGNDTVLDFLGLNEDRTWVFVRYTAPEGGTVTGWASARYIVDYTYNGNSVSLDELEQRGLLTVLDETQRGQVGGEVSVPTGPTPDPLRNVVVAEIFLDDSANLQFRRNPSEQSESLGLIPSGEQVLVVGRDEAGDWLRVEYEGQEGWVSADYVGLTFNGLPYELGDVEIWTAPLTIEQIDATATAVRENPPAEAAATEEQRQVATVEVDVIGMTVEPGGSGDGLPILTRGREVYFVFYSNDLQFALIELEDGTVGWVPAYAIQIRQ